MKEAYEIIFITEEGRAIINKKTKKVYHSEFEIIEENNKEIERLNNIINELEKESHLGMIENQNNNDYSKGLYCAYEYINKRIKALKEDNK